MSYDVRPAEDDVALARFLGTDRRLTAYALCDLDPPYRQNARFIGAQRDGVLEAVLLLYTLSIGTVLILFGSVSGADAILQTYNALPEEPFLIVPPEFLPALERVYAPQEPWTVLRMTVDAGSLRPAPAADLDVRPLNVEDVAAVQELYQHWGSVPFTEAGLRAGVYFGADDSGRLVAVAGTHAVSARKGIGAIGGVFTHPDYRGRGLATATTGAVAHALVDMGVPLIVLNVREDNPHAIRAYERLGFDTYAHLVEGPANRR